MRIFISHSGKDSKMAADLMNNWLPSVIHEVEPWVSTHDIQKGEKWLESLSTSLGKTTFGLLMVTKTNLRAPWLFFEAGAISNVPGSRVVPLLCGINTLDIANTPLSQFQSVAVGKEGLQELITDINKRCSRPLPEWRVKETFEKWWGDFEQVYNSIPFATETHSEQEDEATRFTVIENVLQDIMKYLGRIEQTFRPAVNLADAVAGLIPNPEVAAALRIARAVQAENSGLGLGGGLVSEFRR